MIKNLFRVLFNKERLFYALAYRGFWRFLDDEAFLKIAFRFLMGYRLDLNRVETYNEKLQWLKLHNREPLHTKLVDKYLVKEYVSEIIGHEYIIPTLNVYNSVDEIDLSSLPEKFVLKTNHNSGGIVICNNKSELDWSYAKHKLSLAYNYNFYYSLREWPYKDVDRKIIAEQYIEDSKSGSLHDYKFYCFNGEPKVLLIATERNNKTSETKFDFFDMDFNHLDFRRGHPNSDIRIDKPCSFEKMKELARKLSQGHIHVRVDLYEVDGKVYFGELTFYPGSGFVPFVPKEWDYKMGSWINIPYLR